ncbi:MAG TPA: hypothetical protein VIN61_11330 [Gammaproteobacteria bacterium]
MSKRSRTWFGVVIGLAALAALAAAFLASRLDRAVIAAVERYGSAATGTAVRLRDADVQLRETAGTLSGLSVANPEGFAEDDILTVETIALDVALGDTSPDLLVLNEVVVSGATLNAEQRGAALNLDVLLDRLAGGDPAPDEEPGTRLIIDRFRLAGGRVTLTTDAGGGPHTLDLPEVVVEDVGRAQGGLTYGETAEALLGPILAAGRAALRGRLRDAAEDAVEREIEEAVDDKLHEILER